MRDYGRVPRGSNGMVDASVSIKEELTRLNVRVSMLANWQRAAGLPQHRDLMPPVVHDERFQHPLWTKNPYLDTLKEAYFL
jgi:hypothetical protein